VIASGVKSLMQTIFFFVLSILKIDRLFDTLPCEGCISNRFVLNNFRVIASGVKSLMHG
jgi:hypothetical protein